MSADLPISRVVTVAEVPDQGTHFVLQAQPGDLAALAQVLKLPAIARFEARLHVRPYARDGLSVTGTVEADITQTCVVTLDPFDSTVGAEVDVRLTPPHDERHHRRYPDEDTGGDDDVAGRGADLDAPDPLIDGAVDIGAVAVEFLALSLDPYPRKPDAEFKIEDETAEQDKPFAALGQLLGKGGKP